jgi:hypothetical protein
MFFTTFILSYGVLLCYNKTQGVEGMFKRLTTSLTRPPQAVFFIKDSWGKTLLYFFLIPMLLMIPVWLSVTINPGMSVDRYEILVTALKTDFVLQGTRIEDGTLINSQDVTSSFEYFTLAMGDIETTNQQIVFYFAETELTLKVANITFNGVSYQDLNLENYDFSDESNTNVRRLAGAIKAYYDEVDVFDTSEIFIVYLSALIDYALLALLMAFLMIFVSRSLPFTFSQRLKLSVYLSTIWIFMELVIILFAEPLLDFLAVGVLYVYHFWAYRSIKWIEGRPQG